ncbi:hypothetical protein NKDENANG_02213 [Candidatus Entotheonellaceae bacterium PAL068K]
MNHSLARFTLVVFGVLLPAPLVVMWILTPALEPRWDVPMSDACRWRLPLRLSRANQNRQGQVPESETVCLWSPAGLEDQERRSADRLCASER